MIINPSSNRSEPVIPITGTPNIRTQLWIDPTVEDQNSSYYTAADTLTNSTKELFGLEENAVPDDAFKALLERTENIPSGDVTSGIQMELLWENASPTSNFETQMVELDLSGYQRVGIQFRHTTNAGGGTFYGECDIGEILYETKSVTSYTNIVTRLCTVEKTGITFGNATRWYDFNSSKSSTDNAFTIPYKIYGIKGVTVA